MIVTWMVPVGLFQDPRNVSTAAQEVRGESIDVDLDRDVFPRSFPISSVTGQQPFRGLDDWFGAYDCVSLASQTVAVMP